MLTIIKIVLCQKPSPGCAIDSNTESYTDYGNTGCEKFRRGAYSYLRRFCPDSKRILTFLKWNGAHFYQIKLA